MRARLAIPLTIIFKVAKIEKEDSEIVDPIQIAGVGRRSKEPTTLLTDIQILKATSLPIDRAIRKN